MLASDLEHVGRWLHEPHVARWWLLDTTASAELAKIRARVLDGSDHATRMLTIVEETVDLSADVCPIGWCQWYPYDAYPAAASEVGANPGDCGIDYAIGEPDAIGRGLGTDMVAALVAEARRNRPGCGVVVDPDAANTASRLVLERNGFSLVTVSPVTTGVSDRQVAIYRAENA